MKRRLIFFGNTRYHIKTKFIQYTAPSLFKKQQLIIGLKIGKGRDINKTIRHDTLGRLKNGVR